MTRNRLTGADAAAALFDALPEAAKGELADKLGGIAQDVLRAQRLAVLKRTGKLSAALSIRLMIDRLKVRIGLLDMKGKNRPWYGIIVNFGRKAQTVAVTRRAPGQSRLRSKAASLVQRYSMRVSELPPHEFIAPPSATDDASIDSWLRDFWDNALRRAEA